MIYLITDTHFEHRGPMVKPVEDGGCGRPDNFTDIIIDNWKNMVGPDDLTIHLGDVMLWRHPDQFGYLSKVIPEIPGRKWLIKGNHDPHPAKWYREVGFERVEEREMELVGTKLGVTLLLSHYPVPLVSPRYDSIDYNIHGHWHNSGTRFHPGAAMFYTHRHRLLALEHVGLHPVLLSDFLNNLPEPLTFDGMLINPEKGSDSSQAGQ